MSLQSLRGHHHPPSQGYSQHIRDDAYTPHVRWEGNKVIVHHFRSQELWSSKINLQFLTRFVPLPERETSLLRAGWGTHLTFVKIKAWLFATRAWQSEHSRLTQAIRTALRSLEKKIEWRILLGLQVNTPSATPLQSKTRRKTKGNKTCKGLPHRAIAALLSARLHRMLSSRCCPTTNK